MEIKQKYIYKSKELGEINMSFFKEFKESAFLKDGGMLFHNLGPGVTYSNKNAKSRSW